MRKFVVRTHVVDGYEGMIKYNTANEDVLNQGLTARLEQFYGATSMGRSKENAREVLFQLLGPDALVKRFADSSLKRWSELFADRG